MASEQLVHQEERLPGNVTDIPHAEGTVRFISSTLLSTNAPEEMGKHPHGLGISTWDSTSGYDGDREAWVAAVQEGIAGTSHIRNYRNILERARVESIPIFGIDTPLPPPITRGEGRMEGVASGFGLGLVALAAAHLIMQSPSMTRRQFLRGAADAPLVLGTLGVYFNSSTLAALSAAVLPKGAGANMMEVAEKIKTWQGLGEFTFRMRALMVANKLDIVMNHLKSTSSTHPIIAAATGGGLARPLREALAMEPDVREGLTQALVDRVSNIAPLYAPSFKSMLNTVPCAQYENGAWSAALLKGDRPSSRGLSDTTESSRA